MKPAQFCSVDNHKGCVIWQETSYESKDRYPSVQKALAFSRNISQECFKCDCVLQGWNRNLQKSLFPLILCELLPQAPEELICNARDSEQIICHTNLNWDLEFITANRIQI